MSKFLHVATLAGALTLAPAAGVLAISLEDAKVYTESFNYAAGELVAGSKWQTFSYFSGSQYTDPIKVVEGSLTYPGYSESTEGNCVELISGSEALDEFATVGNVTYSSFLVNVRNVSATGEMIFSFGDPNKSSTDGFSKVFAKKVNDKIAFGVTLKALAGSASFSAAEYDMNTTYLLVAKYTNDNGSYLSELFINPVMGSEEPAASLSSKAGSGTSNKISSVILYQGSNSENSILVDEIRVAENWASLFDDSQIVANPSISVPTSIYIGNMQEGDQPITATINVKASNITEDITVTNNTEGYISYESIIPMAQALSENGYDLIVTLDPKDNLCITDEIKFTANGTNASAGVSWYYTLAVPEYNISALSEIETKKEKCNLTLISKVCVDKYETTTTESVFYISLKDAETTIDFADPIGLGLEAGDSLTFLRIGVRAIASEDTGEPLWYYQTLESPELIIDKSSAVKAVKSEDQFSINSGVLSVEDASAIRIYDLSGKMITSSCGSKISLEDVKDDVMIISIESKKGNNRNFKIFR